MIDPSVLRGRTWTQVAQALHNPSSPVAQAVDGSASACATVIKL